MPTSEVWATQVASIRELVPRLYVEVAILRCYRLLLPKHKLTELVARLGRMVRGFV